MFIPPIQYFLVEAFTLVLLTAFGLERSASLFVLSYLGAMYTDVESSDANSHPGTGF